MDSVFRGLVPVGVAASATVILILISGCASEKAREHLEGVAKGWCETIRASQVIPVYPLTEDLTVGDVFLVQTPISTEARDYVNKGFLPLDDAQVRLVYTNFSSEYFNGYWTNEYGNTPHPVPVYTNSGSVSNGQVIALTDAPVPRAAFPSYSVQAQSGFGFNAAFPIEGIPVALSYLNSQQVNCSVTISDARTYAGDPGQLLALLQAWDDNTTNKSRLAETAKNALPTRIFLRVVSRVYYARAVDISLQRADSQSAGGKGGIVNDVTLLNTNGTVNQNYTNVLGTLTSALTALTNAAQVGAAVKFVSASGSTVGLSQSFDRLLAIGYLGFDVPVDTNGDIGPPIPTFQRLTGKIPTPPQPATPYGADENTAKIRAWLKTPSTPKHEDQLRAWLGVPLVNKVGMASILDAGKYSDTRSNIVSEFKINQ
jgi:hypothetical protein